MLLARQRIVHLGMAAGLRLKKPRWLLPPKTPAASTCHWTSNDVRLICGLRKVTIHFCFLTCFDSTPISDFNSKLTNQAQWVGLFFVKSTMAEPLNALYFQMYVSEHSLMSSFCKIGFMPKKNIGYTFGSPFLLLEWIRRSTSLSLRIPCEP